MNLFVIGATGRTGREIVHLGLRRGHNVTVLARAPETITNRDARLTILKGDPTSEEILAQDLKGQDVVFSVLGPRSFKSSSLLRNSAMALTRAMARAGVKRVIALSAAAHFPGLLNRLVWFILRNHMRDSRAMEVVFIQSAMDWTLVRPPRLTQKKETRYRSKENALPKGGFSISRQAVAAFMLDAAEHKKHIRKIVGVAK